MGNLEHFLVVKAEIPPVHRMSDEDRVCIGVFHRNALSLGEANRQHFGFAIYNWAVLIRPKNIKRLGCSTFFDTTNGPRYDSQNNDLNPDMDWWYRARGSVNPLATGHFLGAVVIEKCRRI